MTCWEQFKLILHLNRIDDPKARQAYIEHRRGSLLIMLSLFGVSKIFHLIYIGTLLGGDLDQYRLENPDVLHNYPSAVQG